MMAIDPRLTVSKVSRFLGTGVATAKKNVSEFSAAVVDGPHEQAITL